MKRPVHRLLNSTGPVLLFAGLCLLLLLPVVARAQQPSGQPAPSRTQQKTSGQNPSSPAGMEGELTRESREAAGEEKGENEQFKKSPSVRLIARATGLSLEHAYWLAVLLNFAVIAAVLVWVSRAKLPHVFRNRTASIQKAMEEARKASAEANQRLTEVEARLARLDVEIAAMRAAAEQEAAAEEARIRAAAEEDKRKIVESSEQEIAAAAKAARRDLKAFAANLAVSLAQQQIRVDSKTDQTLVRNFADHLSDSDTNGGPRGKDGR